MKTVAKLHAEQDHVSGCLLVDYAVEKMFKPSFVVVENDTLRVLPKGCIPEQH